MSLADCIKTLNAGKKPVISDAQAKVIKASANKLMTGGQPRAAAERAAVQQELDAVLAERIELSDIIQAKLDTQESRLAKQREKQFSLESETPAQTTAREALVADQTKQATEAKAKEEAAAKKAREAKEVADRQAGSAENFQLGQSAEESLSGQRDIFSQPAAKQTDIDDFGEKIGGARKDTARPLGARTKSEVAETAEPGWRKRFNISQIAASSTADEVGQWVIHDERKKDWRGEAKQVGGKFATKAEAEDAIPLLAVAQKHRVIPASVEIGAPRKYEIWRTVTDHKRVKVVDQQFDTYDDGLRYMAKHAVEIIETKTAFGEEILAKPDVVMRTGVDRRTGPATVEMFVNAFGFRAVEFGLWNNQDERQEVMNHAYDGLLDLADVLHVPARALSLNGELALAFGARGQGLSGAKAHYERNYGAINLTKMSGAGSLAHEWFHSLDHYLARQDTKAAAERVKNDSGNMVFPAKTQADDYVSHGFGYKSKVREELRAAYNSLIQTMFTKAERYVEDTQKAEKFVGGMRDRLAGSLKELRDTSPTALSRQLQPEYYKRNNKPATAAQLAEFDQLAERLVSGEDLETKFISTAKEGLAARARGGMAGRYSNNTLEGINAIMKAVRGRQGFNSEKTGTLDGVRSLMRNYAARIEMLESANANETKTKRVPTSYAMENKKIDQGRASDYWTSPHEMAARAFSAYVEDKVGEQGNKSDFLAYGSDNKFYRMLGIRPFPEGSERSAINAAFDKFIGELKTKETDRGTMLLQERAVYSVNQPDAITKDIHYGSQHELPGVEGKNPLPGKAGNRVIRAANTLSVREAKDLPGLYHVTAQLVTVGNRELPYAKITTIDQAAESFAYLHKYAVEHYDALVTDKNGKPLAVIGSFKGTGNQTSVYPGTVMMELARIDGAAHVWAAHNHPSGMAELSNADKALSANFAEILRDSGVTYHGLFAIAKAPSGGVDYEIIDSYADRRVGNVPFSEKVEHSVPIVERMIVDAPIVEAINSPSKAKTIVPSLAKESPGIVFLSAQNAPVAFVPLNPKEMLPLREGGRAMKLFRAASRTSAGAVMIANPNGAITLEQAGNISAALLSIDIRTLDHIQYSTTGTNEDVVGRVISVAEKGDLHPYGTTFKSEGAGSVVSPHTISTLTAAIDQAYPETKNFAQLLQDTGKFHIIEAKDIPGDVSGAKFSYNQKMAEKVDTPAGVAYLDLLGHPVVSGSISGYQDAHENKFSTKEKWFFSSTANGIEHTAGSYEEIRDFAISHGFNAPEKAATPGYATVNLHVESNGGEWLEKDRQEISRNKWQGARSVYLRFGNLPSGGKSKNHSDGATESGVSVFRGELLPNGEARIISDHNFQMGSLMMGGLQSRKLYVVTGDEIGIGSDGEPTLKKAKQESIKSAVNRIFGTNESIAPDSNGDNIRFSKDGRILAYHQNGQTYFVADNISQDNDNVRGLLNHELGVHALKLGRTDAEFQGILKQVEQMRKMGNKKVIDARAAVPADTAPENILEEQASYLVQQNPSLSISQKIIAWLRKAIRKLGNTIKGAARFKWFQWANNLTPEDIVAMATEATKRAPSTLGAQQGGYEGTMASKALFSKQGEAQPQKLKAEGGPMDRVMQAVGGKLFAEKITQPAYRVVARALDSKYVFGSKTGKIIKAGIISDYGLSPEYLERRDEIEYRMNRRLRQAKGLIQNIAGLTREESRVAYQWMQEKPDTKMEAELVAQLPEESRQHLQKIKAMVEEMSQEAIKLGQLSPETHARNEMAYLHRAYAKYELENADGAHQAATRRQIMGDQYKGRGLRFEVDPNRLVGFDGKPVAHAELGQKYIRLESSDDTGKVTRRVWWSADNPVPMTMKDMIEDPTPWEVRNIGKGKATLWRDFTRAERGRMGELDEAKFAVANTISKMAHDVEMGKFLSYVNDAYAKDEVPEGGRAIEPGESAWSKENLVQTLAEDTWAKVPSTNVPGTNVPKYGAIAGKYVPGAIWNDIRQTYNPISVPKWYATTMRWWKISKTAMSPSVHTNNVMANLIQADMHDVQAQHVAKALTYMLAKTFKGGIAGISQEKAAALIEEFQDAGGMGGSFVSSELKSEMIKPLLEELRKEMAGEAGLDQLYSVSNAVALIFGQREIRKGMTVMANTKPAKWAVILPKVLIDTYHNEDVLFRLAAYIKERERGASIKDAGKYARGAFLDYTINAPWIQGMRHTVVPFIAFTYRMIPMYAETIRDKPWKIAKYTMVANAIAAIGMALAGIDDDKDKEIQKLLPEDRTGLTPYLTQRQIPISKDEKGNPIYLDVTRWMPLGDIFELRGESGHAFPLPAFLYPSGLAVTAGEMFGNKSLFTGKDIWDTTDTKAEAAGKMFNYAYKSIAPNFPLLPGTYSWDKISAAVGGKTDIMGRNYSVGQALLSSFGIRVNTYDPDLLRYYAATDLRRSLGDLEQNIRRDARNLSRKGMSEEDFSKAQENNQKKMDDAIKSYEEKVR